MSNGPTFDGPRVVMFLPPNVTFGNDWADAASRVADVVRVVVVDEHSWPRVEAFPTLARDPEDAASYQLLRPMKVPRRIFGSAADLPATIRTARALRYLQSIHGRIDLLHAHFYSSARYFPALKRKLGIPYVVTEHSTALTLESPDKKITRRGIRIARSVYRNASTVMPVSSSLGLAISALGLKGNFKIVSNPVDNYLFRPIRGRSVTGRIELVTVARLAAVKAIDVLLEAMAEIRTKGEFHLTVIGSGPLESDLKALRTGLGLDDAVDFVGHRSRSEIADYLNRSDIFVLPSRAENLPVAAIEALMSGVPVVATSVGGLPEMIGPGQGRLVDKDDPEGLASAICMTVDDLEEHDRIAIAASANERFSMEAVGRELLGVYEMVIEGRA